MSLTHLNDEIWLRGNYESRQVVMIAAIKEFLNEINRQKRQPGILQLGFS